MFPLLALKLGGAVAKVKGAWSAMPPKVRLGLLIAVTALIGLLLHQHVAHKRLKAADAAGYARAVAEDAKVIAAMRARAQTAEANGLRISQEVRTRNDTDNRNINAHAAVIVRSGPGAASCRRVGDPAVPAATGGFNPHSGIVRVAVDPVLDTAGSVLIGLPFNDTVAFGKESDLNRAEVLSWREWYARQAAEWERLRAKP